MPFEPIPTNSQPSGFTPIGTPPAQPQPTGLDKAIDFIRPFVGNAVGAGAGALGGALGSIIPGPGTAIGGVLGETQGYAGIDYLLQHLKSNSSRTSEGEKLGEAEKEAVINAVGGKIIGGLFRGVKSLANAASPDVQSLINLKPTTSQALEAYGHHMLATGAKFAEDFGATGAKAEALDRSGGAGFTQALNVSKAINGRSNIINSDPVKLADKIRGQLEEGLDVAGSADELKTANRIFVKDPRPSAEDYTLMQVPTNKVDAAWSKFDKGPNPNFYIPPGGGGATIGNRYKQAQEFLKTGKSVEAPRVSIDDASGQINFEDGRHRFAAIRDAGDKTVGVMVPNEQVSQFEKLGGTQATTPTGRATSQASQEALDILNGGSNPFAKLDAVVKDPDRLEKVLAAGQFAGSPALNVRKDLQAYQFMKMMNEATTKDIQGATRIDPGKLAKQWNDPEMNSSFDTLYGKVGNQARDNITKFFQNVSKVQDSMQAHPYLKQLRMISTGGALLGGLLTGNLHLAEGAVSTIAGLYITTYAIGKLLTKEGTGAIVAKLAGGEALSQPEAIAARAIFDGLQGTTVALMDGQGKKTWGQIEKDPKSNDYTFQQAK